MGNSCGFNKRVNKKKNAVSGICVVHQDEQQSVNDHHKETVMLLNQGNRNGSQGEVSRRESTEKSWFFNSHVPSINSFGEGSDPQIPDTLNKVIGRRPYGIPPFTGRIGTPLKETQRGQTETTTVSLPPHDDVEFGDDDLEFTSDSCRDSVEVENNDVFVTKVPPEHSVQNGCVDTSLTSSLRAECVHPGTPLPKAMHDGHRDPLCSMENMKPRDSNSNKDACKASPTMSEEHILRAIRSFYIELETQPKSHDQWMTSKIKKEPCDSQEEVRIFAVDNLETSMLKCHKRVRGSLKHRQHSKRKSSSRLRNKWRKTPQRYGLPRKVPFRQSIHSKISRHGRFVEVPKTIPPKGASEGLIYLYSRHPVTLHNQYSQRDEECVSHGYKDLFTCDLKQVHETSRKLAETTSEFQKFFCYSSQSSEHAFGKTPLYTYNMQPGTAGSSRDIDDKKQIPCGFRPKFELEMKKVDALYALQAAHHDTKAYTDRPNAQRLPYHQYSLATSRFY